MEQTNKNIGVLPWLYWGCAALFFFCEYFVRVSTGVMGDSLMREFSVTALALGSLSAAFYYAYLGMQLPVGALVDRFGPRLLLGFAAMVSALSCYWFSVATSFLEIGIARFFIGFGASFVFVGAIKLAAAWLPHRYLGLLVGITQGLGMLGASVGEAPMAYAISIWGWRTTMFNCAVLFAFITGFFAVVVKSKAPAPKDDHSPNTLQGLMVVIKNKQTWLNAAYAGLVYAPTAAFGELWGAKYLSTAHSLTLSDAAFAVGMIFIGWTFGGPLAGFISDKIGKRKPVMFGSAIAGLCLLPLVLFLDNITAKTVYTILFFFGLTNGGLIASYALATELNPNNVAGITIGFTNMASVIIGAMLQPVIGALLDWHWDGTLIDNTPIYAASDFKSAILVLPCCLIFAAAFACLVRESNCQALSD